MYFVHARAVRNAWDAGVTYGKYEAASNIKREFGCYDGETPFKEVFSVKATLVLKIHDKGVETIRVIP